MSARSFILEDVEGEHDVDAELKDDVEREDGNGREKEEEVPASKGE